MKTNGEIGSSCLRPLDNLKTDEGDPLTRIGAFLDLRHTSIHFLHNVGNPIALRLDDKKFQFTES
ncbi:hypothetical protein HanXRQr2_Chr03g0094101 [Helianthus annuus]|uniref:Uncharacterized protein n=1 Tax=Helianthus annuus TaxID=4232 RepID=A0A9K3JDU6_HELAN|nr:hypothetical protein HanXRQr2_Chr03g0094101 [Helianthus annuus]